MNESFYIINNIFFERLTLRRYYNLVKIILKKYQESLIGTFDNKS